MKRGWEGMKMGGVNWRKDKNEIKLGGLKKKEAGEKWGWENSRDKLKGRNLCSGDGVKCKGGIGTWEKILSLCIKVGDEVGEMVRG